MSQPTRSRANLRIDVLKKVDPISEPKTSSTTSDSDSLAVLKDTLLAPGAESEDYVGDWIYVRSQPTKVDSGANTNENPFAAADTTLTVDDSSFFTVGDGIQIEDEICRVVTVTDGTTLEVVRGIQGTTDTSHATGTDIYIIGPAIGEIVRVTAVGFSGTNSQLTTAPDFSASLVSGQEYERHRKVRPNIINDRLDVILGLLRQNVLLPVTLLDDGDMEADGITDWTASSATVTKDATHVRRGRQGLKVVATSDDGNAYSNAVYLPPGTQVIVETDVWNMPGANNATIILYNDNDVEEIASATTAQAGWVHLEFKATLPPTCEAVTIILQVEASADEAYFDHATLWPVADQGIDLPSFLEFVYDVKSLFYVPLGTSLTGSADSNAYRINESTPQLYAHFQRERDDTGVVSARFYVEGRTPTNALWIKGRKPYSAFAGTTDALKDADTTQAHKNVVVNMTAASIIDDFALDATDAEKFELARKLGEKAFLLRFEIQHILANLTPPRTRTITTPFTRKRI